MHVELDIFTAWAVEKEAAAEAINVIEDTIFAQRMAQRLSTLLEDVRARSTQLDTLEASVAGLLATDKDLPAAANLPMRIEAAQARLAALDTRIA